MPSVRSSVLYINNYYLYYHSNTGKEEKPDESVEKIPCIQVAVLPEKTLTGSKKSPGSTSSGNDDFDKIVKETRAAAQRSSPIAKETEGGEKSECEEYSVTQPDSENVDPFTPIPQSVSEKTKEYTPVTSKTKAKSNKNPAAISGVVVPNRRSSRSGLDQESSLPDTRHCPKMIQTSSHDKYVGNRMATRRSVDKESGVKASSRDGLTCAEKKRKMGDKVGTPGEGSHLSGKDNTQQPDTNEETTNTEHRHLRSSAESDCVVLDKSKPEKNTLSRESRSRKTSNDRESVDSSASRSARETRSSVDKQTGKRPASQDSNAAGNKKLKTDKAEPQTPTRTRNHSSDSNTSCKKRSSSGSTAVVPPEVLSSTSRTSTRLEAAKSKLCTRNRSKLISQKVHQWKRWSGTASSYPQQTYVATTNTTTATVKPRPVATSDIKRPRGRPPSSGSKGKVTKRK